MEKIIESLKKIRISRSLIEKLALVLIVLLGLTVFTVPVKSKGTLTYNEGKSLTQGRLSITA